MAFKFKLWVINITHRLPEISLRIEWDDVNLVRDMGSGGPGGRDGGGRGARGPAGGGHDVRELVTLPPGTVPELCPPVEDGDHKNCNRSHLQKCQKGWFSGFINLSWPYQLGPGHLKWLNWSWDLTTKCYFIYEILQQPEQESWNCSGSCRGLQQISNCLQQGAIY